MPRQKLPTICSPCKTSKKITENHDTNSDFGTSCIRKKISFDRLSSVETLPPIPNAKKPPKRHGEKSSAQRILNSWAYRLPIQERIIYGGYISPKFFNEICYGWKRVPGDEDFVYKRIAKRDGPLWEPKKPVSLTCRRTERAIVEARDRQRKILADISKRAEKLNKRQNATLARKAEIMDKRITSYLKNVDRKFNVRPPSIKTPCNCGANVDLIHENKANNRLVDTSSFCSEQSFEMIDLNSSEFDLHKVN